MDIGVPRVSWAGVGEGREDREGRTAGPEARQGGSGGPGGETVQKRVDEGDGG